MLIESLVVAAVVLISAAKAFSPLSSDKIPVSVSKSR